MWSPNTQGFTDFKEKRKKFFKKMQKAIDLFLANMYIRYGSDLRAIFHEPI